MVVNYIISLPRFGKKKEKEKEEEEGRLKTQNGNLRKMRVKKKKKKSERACWVENPKGRPRQKLRQIKMNYVMT